MHLRLSNKAHEGIREYYRSLNVSVPDEGISPLQEFNRDTRQLVYMDAGVVGEAFMYHESRKVDKGACISFQGRRYETKPKLIGKTVEIAYDPAAPEIITISSEGLESFQAKPLKIGEYCYQRQSRKAFICCRQTALCCSHCRCRLWKVNADTQVFSESAEGKIYLPLPVGFKAHAKMVL